MTSSTDIIENPPPPYEDVNGWVVYYFNIWGANTIPAPVQDKNKPKNEQESFWPVHYEDYKSKRITDEDQKRWIDAGEYTGPARGIAIILGRVWVGPMAGKWLVGIDVDNQKGIELVCEMFGCTTIEELTLKGIVVEQHIEDAPHKAHFYFYVDSPLHNLPGIKSRYSGDKTKDWAKLAEENKIPAIEIKCAGGGVHFVTPSKHSGGYTYKHVAGSPPVPTLCLSESETADAITKLEEILHGYGDSYLDYQSKNTGKTIYPSIEEMYKPDYIVYAGNNRHLECRRLGASLLIRSGAVKPEQSLSEVLVWNNGHCVPPLEVDDVKAGFYKYSMTFAKKKLKERWNQQSTTSEPAATVATTTRNTTKAKMDYYEYILDYSSRTAKEENTLLRQILLTVLSAHTQGLANNLNLRAPSSEGKSWPVMQVINACTTDFNQIIILNHITPTALIYRSGGLLVDKDGKEIGDKVKQYWKWIRDAKKAKDYDTADSLKEKLDDLLVDSAYRLDLTGKCFVLLEPPKENLWDLLKAILSHDAFEIKHMMTDKSMTGLKTKTVILRGWPAFIYCSAKDETHSPVWEEVLTRFMTTAPNMVQKKYYEGNKLTARKMGLPNFAPRRIEIFGTPADRQKSFQCYETLKNQIKSYCSTSESNPVWIPFLEQLSELLPAARGADNRTTSRIFQLLIIITLARAHLHHTLVDMKSGQRCVISTLEDLQEALHVTQNVSGLAPHKERFYFNIVMKLYHKKVKELEELRKNNSKIKAEIFFTSTEIAEAYNETVPHGGRKYNADGITNAYLDELHNRSYIEKMQDPRTNKIQYVYYPIVEVDATDTEDEISTSETTQVGLTFLPYSTDNGKKLQFRKLLLPNNHKGFDKDWLKVQFEQDFRCRIEDANLKVYDPDNQEIAIADYTASYETPELNLSHFYAKYKSEPRPDYGKEKEPESEIISPALEKCIVKIINESLEIKETLPLSANYGQNVKNNRLDNGGGGGSMGDGGGVGGGGNTPTTIVHPAQYQQQALLVEAYEQEQREKAKVGNEDRTLTLLNQQRNKISPELAPLFKDSVNMDSEWINQRNVDGIRRMYSISFVDWLGKERVFHIDDYKDISSEFERTRTMLNDAFSYWFDNYRLSFGFNSLGKDSDRDVIYENAQFYNTIIQPVEEVAVGQYNNRRTYYKFKERELKHTHIDVQRIFKNKAVHTYIFEQKYRTFGLEAISQALYGVGKYKGVDGLEAGTQLSTNEQKQYVLQDSRLLSLLTMAEDGNLFGAMQYIADLLELSLQKVCHSQVSQYWTVLYQKSGHTPPPLVEKINPEKNILEMVGQNYYYKTKTVVATRGKNKGQEKIKVISYSGGRVLEPTPGFYRDIIGLDQESQYPSISIMSNVGFETLCCEHEECRLDPACQIKDTEDPEIDSAGYYVCKKQGDSVYKQKLMVFRKARIEAKEKGERVKDLALKIIINGAYGVYGYKKFAFADTRVAEIITAYGRKMHRAMERMARAPLYDFNIIGGDTDSILIEYPKDKPDGTATGQEMIEMFCDHFKHHHGITVKPSKKIWSKMLITKKKHYIYWELGNENNPTVKGMEAAKNNMPKLTNIIFDQFIKNIGADRDFITDLRKAWTVEYPYCKRNKPELLVIEVKLGVNPEDYKGDTLNKRLALHQSKVKDETVKHYEIVDGAEKEHGPQAYLDPQYIDDEKYRQKYFISPFKAMLKELGYDAEEVFAATNTNLSESGRVPKQKIPLPVTQAITSSSKKIRARQTIPHSKKSTEKQDIIFERVWAMPSKRTFQIPPIAQLIEEECAGIPQDEIVDLFPYDVKVDAYELLKSFPTASKSVMLVDPPYTMRQFRDLKYSLPNGIKPITWESSKEWWTEFRKEMARVLKPGGKCITCAWNTQGTGKGLGFEVTRILQVPHGGNRNDTIVTVDVKTKEPEEE